MTVKCLTSADSSSNTTANGYLEDLLLSRYDYLFNKDGIEPNGVISDIGEVIGGATPSKKKPEYYTQHGIGWITPRDLSNTTDKFIAHGADDITQLGYDSCSVRLMPAGTVLFSSRAPIGYVAIAADEVTTNQGFKSIVPNDDIGTAFFYCFLKQNKERIADAGSGTTFPEVSGRTMKSIELVIPDKDQCAEFSEWASPILEHQQVLEVENHKLKQLRDTLLPKLMSGEIDVSKVEVPAQPNSHLRRFHPILQSVPTTMKGTTMETIINAVLAQMQPFLDGFQFKQLAVSLKAAFENAERPPQQDRGDLLELFLTAKEVEGCSPKTIAYYRTTLEHMTATIAKPYTQMTSEDLRDYLNGYGSRHGAGKVTIDNIRRIMSSFFSWLEDEDYVVKSPVRRIHRIKTAQVTKEVLTDEQIESLRDGCSCVRDLAIIDVLASSGMRVGELVGLDISDVNLQERECIVTGKGNKQRPVYLDARAKLHLSDYLKTRRDDNPALFVTLRGRMKRMTVSDVEARVRELGRATQVGRVHPHKFRRTLATRAIDRGMPIEQVQKLLGHAKIDTTMHYAMVDQNNVKTSHRKYLE